MRVVTESLGVSSRTPPSLPDDPEDGEEGPLPKLFTPSFLLAIAINLCLAMVFFMLITGMAVYAAREFAVGQGAAGFAASAFVVGAVFARIFAGKYVDFLGRRRTVFFSMVLYVLAGIAYLGVDNYELLIAVRLAHGVAFGFGQTALTAGVFAMLPRSRRGEGSGYYMVANSLPQALGPALALQLSYAVGFWAMFVSSAVIGAVGLALSLLIKLPEARGNRQRLPQRLMLKPEDVIDHRALSIALITMLISVGFGSIITYLDSFTQHEDMTSIASLYFVVFAGAVLLARLFVGRLQDRHGDNIVVYPAVAMFVIALTLLGWSPNEAVVLMSAVLAGLGHGALMPVLQAIVASAVPPQRVSIGLSTFFIMMNCGVGFSPLLLGPLVGAVGYRFMYLMSSALVVAALIVYWLLHGRYDVHQGAPRRPRS